MSPRRQPWHQKTVRTTIIVYFPPKHLKTFYRNIKPIVKKDEDEDLSSTDNMKRELSPELAKISALVTGQPKPKLITPPSSGSLSKFSVVCFGQFALHILHLFCFVDMIRYFFFFVWKCTVCEVEMRAWLRYNKCVRSGIFLSCCMCYIFFFLVFSAGFTVTSNFCWRNRFIAHS